MEWKCNMLWGLTASGTKKVMMELEKPFLIHKRAFKLGDDLYLLNFQIRAYLCIAQSFHLPNLVHLSEAFRDSESMVQDNPADCMRACNNQTHSKFHSLIFLSSQLLIIYFLLLFLLHSPLDRNPMCKNDLGHSSCQWQTKGNRLEGQGQENHVQARHKRNIIECLMYSNHRVVDCSTERSLCFFKRQALLESKSPSIVTSKACAGRAVYILAHWYSMLCLIL